MSSATIVRRIIARIKRSDIMVSGDTSSSKNFVAIKEAPQKITASSGSQNMYLFFLMRYEENFLIDFFHRAKDYKELS